MTRRQPIVEPRKLNREGEHALQRALRILEADPGASTQTLIETLIQMGDWYQIKKSPREALPYYQRAWQLIREAPSLPELRGHCAERSGARLLSDTADRGSRPGAAAGRNTLPLRADRVHRRR